MSVSGPNVLGALDDALHDIRREEDEILRKLGRAAERIAKIRETEGDLLRQFAAGKLEPAQEAELARQLTGAQVHARELLAERTSQIASATEQLGDFDRQLAGLVAARTEALAEVDSRQTALRALSSRIAMAVTRDRDYAQQNQNLARLRAVATAARAKLRQAEIDRDQKGRAYREDPLFAYLNGRQYGTPQYKSRGLIAKLDGWVASLIGYEIARRHFALLNQWPIWLRAHAERQAATAAEAESMIDEIERSAIDAAGGSAIRLALDEALARVAAIDNELLSLQDERDALMAGLIAALNGPDRNADAALNALLNALGSPDLQSLIGTTRRTQPGADNALIAQLDDARLRIAEERIDARDLKARLITLADRRRALEDIEYEFKGMKFDDPRSVFRDDGLVTTALSGFLTGTIAPNAYWESFRRSQAWIVGTSDWGGGVGLPRHGRQAAETLSGEASGFNRPRGAEKAEA